MQHDDYILPVTFNGSSTVGPVAVCGCFVVQVNANLKDSLSSEADFRDMGKPQGK